MTTGKVVAIEAIDAELLSNQAECIAYLEGLVAIQAEELLRSGCHEIYCAKYETFDGQCDCSYGAAISASAELQRLVEFWKNSSEEWKLAYVALGGTASKSGKEELSRLLEEAKKVPEGWQLVRSRYAIGEMPEFYDAVGKLLDRKVAGSYCYGSDDCAELYAAMLAQPPKEHTT